MRLAKRKIHRTFGSLFPHGCTPSDLLSDMWIDTPPEAQPIYGPSRVIHGLGEDDWEDAVSSLVEAFQEICLHEPKRVNISGSLYHSEQKNDLQQLNNYFYFKDSKLVCEFLERHGFLVSILFETRKKIDRIFGSDTLTNLELFTDPEDNHSNPKLFALILTALPSDDASTRLEQLDQEWWLDQPREVRRVLNIDVDYIDGV